MKKDEIVSIPFVAHESSMNRMERANKRLTILAVIEAIIIVIMFLTRVTNHKIQQKISNSRTAKINIQCFRNIDYWKSLVQQK